MKKIQTNHVEMGDMNGENLSKENVKVHKRNDHQIQTLNTNLRKYPKPEKMIASGRIDGNSIHELSPSEELFIYALNFLGTCGNTNLEQVYKEMFRLNYYPVKTCQTAKCSLVKKGILFIENNQLFLVQGIYTYNLCKTTRVDFDRKKYIYRTARTVPAPKYNVLGDGTFSSDTKSYIYNKIIGSVSILDNDMSLDETYEQFSQEYNYNNYKSYRTFINLLTRKGLLKTTTIDGVKYISLADNHPWKMSLKMNTKLRKKMPHGSRLRLQEVVSSRSSEPSEEITS